MKTALRFGLIWFLTTPWALGCARGRVTPDLVSESSAMDNDATVVIQGCGNQPIVGFTYCRVAEGDSTDDKIYFLGPPSRCQREACVFMKVYDNQGTQVWGGSVPRGKTQIGVSWRELLSQSQGLENTQTSQAYFDLSHRGFWSVNQLVYWRDKDGNERQSQAQGDIVLRIYKQSYTPLQEIADDPNFVWKYFMSYQKKDYLIKTTSSLRSYVAVASAPSFSLRRHISGPR